MAISIEQVEILVDEVRRRIDDPANTNGIALKVVEGGFRIEDEWVYVVVTPEDKSVRTYDYVEQLSKIECDLKENGFENVLLVPALDS